MRTTLPPVKLEMHPAFFDLLMTVLEDNAMRCPLEETRAAATELLDKEMKYSRVYTNEHGPYVSIRMYESEAAKMIWQLLIGAVDNYEVIKEYSKELSKGGTKRVSSGRDDQSK